MIDSSRLQAATPPYTLSRALHSSKDSRSSLSLALLLKQGLLWPAESSPDTAIPNDTERAGTDRSVHISRNIIAPFGTPAIDSHLSHGGLSSGVIHEWFSAREEHSTDLEGKSCLPAMPPLSLLTLLVGNAAYELGRQTTGNHQKRIKSFRMRDSFSPAQMESEGVQQSNPVPQWNRYIFWIGKECWPSPYVLYRYFPSPLLLKSCIFIDAEADSEKLSLLDIILRSPATFAVTTYLKKLSIAQSKRLSLAINSQSTSHGRFAFICRPPNAEKALSTAYTRWRISPLSLTQKDTSLRTNLYHELPPLAWKLTLLKQKGPQSRIREWNLLLREN
ncbi:MAG: hypothetical protein ACO3XO_04270, partial [Bdellovibrionota bacterium]